MKVLAQTAVVLLAAVSMVSCSKSSPGTNPTPALGPVTITIIGTDKGNLSFSPNPVDAGGKSVVFKNSTGDSHRVVLNTDASQDTGDIAPGATSKALVMPASGTNYHCSTHKTMGGAVEASGGGAPPPCVDTYCY